jgi:galactokinase
MRALVLVVGASRAWNGCRQTQSPSCQATRVNRTLPERLAEVVGPRPEVAFAAPGRANLIGEHTDHNDGFVLPVALELTTVVAGRRAPGRVRLISLDEPGHVEVDLATGRGPAAGWGRYLTAVVRALRDERVAVAGLDGALASSVPLGAGLSSSAALEVAFARAVAAQDIEPVALARICRRAENDYVGVQTGIMDQLASAGAKAGHALLIDCLEETFTPIPIPAELAVLVVDSGVRRELGDSGYNRRRAECQAAADALGLPSLRHARHADLGRLDGVLRGGAPPTLPPNPFPSVWVLCRCFLPPPPRHVVTENARVLEAAQALGAGDLAGLGPLFRASHDSLSGDFDASTPEVDALVDIAASADGVVGARLTGGGWGGCVIALARTPHVAEVALIILQRYEVLTGRTGRYWVSSPADGAGPLATS